jgi:hypothetical protein
MTLGLFYVKFEMGLNTKSKRTLPYFHWLLIHPHRTNGLEVTEFCATIKLLKLFLDRTVAERSSIFQSRICQNSGSPEYHFGRQPSQLSDGPLNDSKRLAICELRQSKTRLVAESVFLTDHTFLYMSGFWQNFAMISLETLYTKNFTNELSFLLATHTTRFDIRFGRYSILKFCFSSG